LKIPLCGGELFCDRVIRRMIYAGAVVGFVCDMVVAFGVCATVERLGEFSLFGIRPMFRRNHRDHGRVISLLFN